MIYQEFDSRKINHFLSGFIGLLIVSCEPPESVKPCECPFHDPSQRPGSKTFDPVWGIADLKLYHKIGLYLICNISAITSVHENFLKCRPKESCLSAQRIGKFGIMPSGIVNCPSKDEAVAVNLRCLELLTVLEVGQTIDFDRTPSEFFRTVTIFRASSRRYVFSR